MSDRTAFVRDSMRRLWGGRTVQYVASSAGNTDRYAALLLDEVAPRPSECVLDVATGPGVVALLAAAAVGPDGRVVATDLAPEWGEVVARGCRAAGLANVEFRAASADALGLPEDAFDLVLCQFGLMFVPEPVEALREMRRVLRPGGRLGVVVWSTADRVRVFSATAPLLQPYLPTPLPGRSCRRRCGSVSRA